MEYPERDDSFKRVRNALGVTLILLGVAGVIWIAINIVQLVQEPSSVVLAQAFTSMIESDRTILISGQPLVLPRSLLFGTGIVLFLMAMGVAAALARSLIVGGVNLLEHDIRRLLRDIKADTRRLHSE